MPLILEKSRVRTAWMSVSVQKQLQKKGKCFGAETIAWDQLIRTRDFRAWGGRFEASLCCGKQYRASFVYTEVWCSVLLLLPSPLLRIQFNCIFCVRYMYGIYCILWIMHNLFLSVLWDFSVVKYALSHFCYNLLVYLLFYFKFIQ